MFSSVGASNKIHVSSVLFDYLLVCTTEQQLIRKLLQFYEPSVRPVHQAQAVVNISFRMEITQLFELVGKIRLLIPLFDRA